MAYRKSYYDENQGWLKMKDFYLKIQKEQYKLAS